MPTWEPETKAAEPCLCVDVLDDVLLDRDRQGMQRIGESIKLGQVFDAGGESATALIRENRLGPIRFRPAPSPGDTLQPNCNPHSASRRSRAVHDSRTRPGKPAAHGQEGILRSLVGSPAVSLITRRARVRRFGGGRLPVCQDPVPVRSRHTIEA
jgi:hypothetical protein